MVLSGFGPAKLSVLCPWIILPRGVTMKILLVASVVLLTGLTRVMADESPRIALIESSTPTEALLAKPGTYIGEKFTFEDKHSGDVLVRVGVWEAGAGKTVIENFPFTEYVLMISGSVIVTDKDGTPRKFLAGDTFVIPKGWSGDWDVQERMKKQIVRIGDARLQTRGQTAD
jgi:uncharacterized cupin superfamily protein